jgi:ankyrin repeat protein
MKQISEYRTKFLNELAASASEFRQACLAVQDPFQPVDEEGWTVHQIAAHVRDVDQLVYGLRARRTAEEDNPEFANFDGEAYAREHYSRDESLENMLDGFLQSVESLVDRLRNLPPAAWSRVSRHEKLGANLTLQLWVERNLAHIDEHLETVRKAK